MMLTLSTGPFVATIAATVVFTGYMILGSAAGLVSLMDLTPISWDFKMFIFTLGIGYLILAWVGEHVIFQRLARLIGKVKQSLTKEPKKRKEYKVILERMIC